MVFWLGADVEDAEYPNLVGDQDRSGAGGEVFPGRALAFDGVDQSAKVLDLGDLDVIEASTDFCVSAIFKANTNSSEKYIAGKGTTVSVVGKYGWYINANNLVRFVLQTSTGLADISTTIDGDADTDFHVFTSRIDLAGAKIYVYVDGVLINAGGTAFTGTIAAVSDSYGFVIGGSNATYVETEVRDVRIYHKDVTSAANLASLQKGEQLGDEVAWWFCEGTDLFEVLDASGNEYHLTAENFDSTSFVEGNWQSLMNKFGYAIDVTGPEQVVNGSFDTDTDWGVGAGWVIANGVATGTSTTSQLDQSGIFEIGRTYLLAHEIKNYVSGIIRWRCSNVVYSINRSASGIYSEFIVPDGLTIRTHMLSAFTGEIDNVSVKLYYDTAVPPDMSTGSGGLPTHDVFGNALTFAGQAKYTAIARDRS